MSGPWLERWAAHYQGNLRVCDEQGRTGARPEVVLGMGFGAMCTPVFDARQRLAAAAPALVRALLVVEFSAEAREGGFGCPECGEGARGEPLHAKDCVLDAALTLAGLADPSTRDAARKDIARLGLR